MRVICILFLLNIIVPKVYAAQFWVIFGDTKRELERFKSGFISPTCNNCLALQASSNKATPHPRLSTNPGGPTCKKNNGKVKVGKLYSGHSQAFCMLKDNSFISLNILF
jgi:hypothetical protein